MWVTVGFIAIGEYQVATLRSTVTIEVADSINNTVRSKWHWEHILAKCLIPDDIFALTAIQYVGDATAGHIIFIFRNLSALITVGVEVVETLASAIAPKRISTVHANHITGIVAIGNLTAIVADPATESSCFTTTADTTGIETVNHFDAAGTVHTHSADTGSILFGCSDAALITAVLESNRTTAICSTGNGGNKAFA